MSEERQELEIKLKKIDIEIKSLEGKQEQWDYQRENERKKYENLDDETKIVAMPTFRGVIDDAQKNQNDLLQARSDKNELKHQLNLFDLEVEKTDIATLAKVKLETYFKKKGDEEAERASGISFLIFSWLIIWCLIGFMTASCRKMTFIPSELCGLIVEGNVTEELVQRAPFLFVFVTVMLVLLHMYKAARHRQYAYEEKVVYIETFLEFRVSGISKDVKDAVLEHAASAIFSGVETGLIKHSGDTVNVNVGGGKD